MTNFLTFALPTLNKVIDILITLVHKLINSGDNMLLPTSLSHFNRRVLLARFLVLILLFSLTACAKKQPNNQIFLMPAPDVYNVGAIDPFTDFDPIEAIPYEGMLYATDRKPAEEGDEKNIYLNERGFLLRVGVGKIEAGKIDMTWEEAREISLLKNRTDKYPMKITEVREIGILAESYSHFFDPEVTDIEKPGKDFAAMINAKLAKSKRKDIYIYVHGYKVVFENPLLVSTELWHFLGYDGVFIAYSWPSTPKTLAYFSDLETTSLSADNLRLLLEYLARDTDAENIHIIGYSAGTRLVINALNQLALIYKNEDKETFRKYLRIGHVILAGSDFDRQLFGAYIDNGILKVSKNFTIYLSEMDKALGMSKWVFNRDRLGQTWDESKMTENIADWLWNTDEITFIDVKDAEKSSTGNGHAYFRKSPWVSSDILSTLLYDLTPEERSLTRTREWPMWKFPPDYIKTLAERLAKENPALAPLTEKKTE
jgi:esterase/lipase superfamily enzyme